MCGCEGKLVPCYIEGSIYDSDSQKKVMAFTICTSNDIKMIKISPYTYNELKQIAYPLVFIASNPLKSPFFISLPSLNHRKFGLGTPFTRHVNFKVPPNFCFLVFIVPDATGGCTGNESTHGLLDYNKHSMTARSA